MVYNVLILVGMAYDLISEVLLLLDFYLFILVFRTLFENDCYLFSPLN